MPPGDEIVEPIHVYRLYGADGALLYVGQSFDPESRVLHHRFSTRYVRWESEVFPDRATASAEEDRLIRENFPPFNTNRVRKGPPPRRVSTRDRWWLDPERSDCVEFPEG